MLNFNWNWDIIIFVAYLVINLSVGLYYSRGTKNIKEYAIGRKNFSTGLIVSTVIATYVSGSGFFITLSKTYSEGLLYFISSQGMALSFIIIALIFIPRMGEFFNVTSVAEAMGNFYGKNVRIIIAVAGTIGAAGSIAVQFKAFSNVFNYFLGIPANIAIFIAAGIMIAYSAIGGIRSIAYTDILQFFIFGFVVPIVGILVWNHAYSQGFSLAKAFTDPIFDYKQALNVKNPDFWYMIPILLYFAIPTMKPYEFQDIIISRNIRQAKLAFIITAICLFLMKLATAWIPFLIHNMNPNLQPNHLLSYVIDNYTYTGLKGLIIIGIASMAMSSADAYLNASAVLFANDICSPLNLSIKNRLLLSRLFALFLGFAALIIAIFSGSDLLKIILTANSFYMPIVTVPVFLTILGFRSTTKSVLVGMIAGLITVIIWQLLKIKVDCIVFGMLVNLLFLIGTHYLLKQPGGWVKNKDNTIINNQLTLICKIKKILNDIKEFELVKFLKNNAPISEANYVAFGVFCLLSTITIIYSTQEALLGKNANIVLFLYQMMLVLSVCFITYPIWPNLLKKDLIIQLMWNFSILFLLIFCNAFFCIISKFDSLPIIVFTVNMIIAGILTNWRFALMVIFLGIYLSIKLSTFANIRYMDINTVNNGTPQFILMYSLLLIGTAVIIFFIRPKQQCEKTSESIREHLKSDNEQKRLDLIKVSQYREEFIERLNNDCIKVFNHIYKQIITIKRLKKTAYKDQSFDLLNNIVDRLKSGAKYLEEIILQTKNNIILNLINLNFYKFINKVVEQYKQIQNNEINIAIDCKIDPEININFDPKLIKKLIIACLEHGIERSISNNIMLIIEQDRIEYDTKHLTKLRIKREALKLSMIFDTNKLLPTDQNIKLISKKIIKDLEKDLYSIIFSHYGILDIKLTENGKIIYSIIIPMDIKAIRPKKMDLINKPNESIKEVNELVTEKINSIIKKLIQEGMSYEFISKVTQLTVKEIQELNS